MVFILISLKVRLGGMTSLFDICQNGVTSDLLSDKEILTIFTGEYNSGREHSMITRRTIRMDERIQEGCPICFDKLDQNNTRIIKCNSGKHVLCEECSIKYFRQNNNCPCCRENLYNLYWIYTFPFLKRYLATFPDLNIIDEDGCPALIHCIKNNRMNVFKSLLDLNVDVNVKDAHENYAIHYAYWAYHEFSSEDDDPEWEFLPMLLDKYPDINVRNVNGETILHQAIINNDYDWVSRLADFDDVDFSISDNEGNTPLGLISRFRYTTVSSYIIQRTDDLYLGNSISGNSPIQMMIVRNNNDKAIENFMGEMKEYRNIGYKIHQNFMGKTDLHFCVYYRKRDYLNFFLQNYEKWREELDLPTFSEYLEIKDNLGRTALYAACESGYLEGALMLLNKGADINTRNNEGKDLTTISEQNGHGSVAYFLNLKKNNYNII